MEQINRLEQQAVDVLFSAYQKKEPLSKQAVPEDLDKASAYRIQHLVTEQKEAAGEKLQGYKISLTSKETQNLFASDSPLYGALTGPAISEGIIELDSMLSPLLELEVVFIAKEELLPNDDVEAILRKTDVAAGIEVPDSRFEDWFPKVTLGQVIADSAVAGKIVIGERKTDATFESLENIKGTLTFNGEELAAGTSAEVLGHPVHAVKWLIEELALHGRTLQKGMVVSSGTFILPKKLERGLYTASYEGLGEVTLQVK